MDPLARLFVQVGLLGLLFTFAIAAEEKGYRVNGSESRLVSSQNPPCTEAAKKEHVKGTTVLWVMITERGKVTAARVTRSLRKDLDREAVRAVKKWIFKPATKDGKPVAIQANIEVNFDL